MGSTEPETLSGASSPPRSRVQEGLRTYGASLKGAGGREMNALLRNNDPGAVCVGMYASPPYDLRVPALPVARLSLNLTVSRTCGGLAGERPRQFDSARYSIFLTPAAAEVRWRKESPSRHVNVYFHSRAFAGEDDDAPLLDCATIGFFARLPGARLIIDELVAELQRPDVLAAEATDSLARLLLVRLARRRPRDASTASAVTPRVLALLREYVEAHMSERILVADLAAIAGLSPNRFAHAFTERTGQPPHQFVRRLRLERATMLLRQSSLSLVDISAACGFSSQQHLTETMRVCVGATPAKYRAAQDRG